MSTRGRRGARRDGRRLPSDAARAPRSVALKAIAPELAADPDFRERFQRESLLVASIDHPNVIPIYEAGERDGTLYLIMRWVDGTDLRTLLTTSGRLSPDRTIKLLRPVASALAATHRRGLVHRDIKPANILIARSDEEDEDHVYLTDFGIAAAPMVSRSRARACSSAPSTTRRPSGSRVERETLQLTSTRSVACCSKR